MGFTMSISAASRRKLIAGFEKEQKELHAKKLKKLEKVLEDEFKKEIKAVGLVKTGKFLNSVKAKADGNTVHIFHNKTGSFVKIKGSKKSFREHFASILRKKIEKFYENA